MLSRETLVWNRACLEHGGPSLGDGDRALGALLRAHGLVMNGGVIHALEVLSGTERVSAIAGYHYFGLSDAAEVLSRTEAPGDEEAYDSAYHAAVPDDEVIVQAFRAKLQKCPDAFA